MAATQKNKEIGIATPLAEDALLLKTATISEQLGRLFQIEATLLSQDPAIKLDSLVGENVTIRLNLEAAGEQRFFNGFVSRIVQSRDESNFAKYTATIVPWLWFLTRTSDCRIFQKKKVPEIIEQVFKDLGFDGYELRLSGTHPVIEYCVQYRESDFNFVSRLMEQEGIYYFFEHENGKHTLVLADDFNAHHPRPGYEEMEYRPPSEAAPERPCITDWVMEKSVQPGTYAINDFNFEKVKTSLLSVSTVSRSHAAADFVMYDYPGEYKLPAEGENYAKMRIQELQAQHAVVHGQTTVRGVATGALFTLKDHPRGDQNVEHLITGASYQLDAGSYETTGKAATTMFYSCSFIGIESQTPFRAARITSKPLITGPQTAMVVGKKGEEIDTDEFGRVKVQFHWDRYGKVDENSSCWIRVAQSWAGKQWGAIYTPRIGQEVIVEFLEGDPDRPIITGRVYNGEAKPPYDLPANKTISTTKSNSSKGGEGFNEIRFEDKKGDEQIFIHGEKNYDTRIKNDCFEWIGNNRHLVVVKDQFEHVKNNRDETVDADHKEKIGKDRHLKVTGKEAIEIGESHSFTVKGDVIEVFKENHSEETTKDYYLKAANIVIEGTSNVTIKVGGSSIAIEAGGIGLKTSGEIKIEAGGPGGFKASGPLTLESSATADLKSPATTVDGSGMATIKGGMVKIN